MAYDPYGGSGEFGASPFDEFLARFFSNSAPRRPVPRIDIGQLMTEQARELVRDAAAKATQLGDPDLDYPAGHDPPAHLRDRRRPRPDRPRHRGPCPAWRAATGTS